MIHVMMPVRNRAWVLPRTLAALLAQNYPHNKTSIHFLVNDSTDGSLSLVQKFREAHGHEYMKVTVEELTTTLPADYDTRASGRTELVGVYNKLAQLRNHLLDTIPEQAEYALSLDSDIVIEPGTISKLAEHGKHFCSALVFNDWLVAKPEELRCLQGRIVNCMADGNEPGVYTRLQDYKLDGLFPTAISGACALLSRKAFTSGARYGAGKAGNTSEDFGFCEGLRSKGIKLWCDGSIRPLHIMSRRWAELSTNTPGEPLPPDTQVLMFKVLPISSITPRIQGTGGPLCPELLRGPRRIVYPHTVKISHLWQRPQHMLNAFAEDGYEAVFCDPEVGQADVAARMWNPDAHINFRVSNTDAVSRLQTKGALYLTWPLHGMPTKDILEHRGAKRVFIWYDILDVDEVFWMYNTKLFQEGKAWLLKHANLVTASARSLVEDARKVRPDTVYVPNGVTPEHFTKYSTLMPECLSHITAPIVGFYGAVANWLDADWMHAAIKAFPRYHFVVIGPSYNEQWAGFEGLSNYTRVGHVPYISLPSYSSKFTICVLPFKQNKLTEAVSPLKFFEYLATGKPIVSGYMPELEQFKDLVYLCKTQKQFVRSIETAMREAQSPDGRAEQRIAAAHEHSWKARYASIRPHFEAFFGRSR